MARLPGRASLSIVIVTALIVAALVAAAFFLPARFMNVLWGSESVASAVSPATVRTVPTVPSKPADTATMKPLAAKTTPAVPATPKVAGDVVANTFQTIFAGPNGPSLEQTVPAAKPSAALAALPTPMSAPKPAPTDGKGVATRVVDTLVIHADPKTGAIEIPAVAPADGAAPAVPATPASPGPQAVAPAAPPDSLATAEAAPIPLTPPPALADRSAPPAPSLVASADQAPAAAAKPAAPAKPEPAASKSAIIGGEGVTVRAGPATARTALFTLAAGKKVAVSGKEHGWLHITDAKGRTGWLYSGLVQITKD